MRGLAFGILDPGGERYRLARLHQRECPACRAYVLSLRGLAAVLPPLPLPWGLAVPPAHAKGPARGGSARRRAPGGGRESGRGDRRWRGTGAGLRGGRRGCRLGLGRRGGGRRRRGLAAGWLGGREAGCDLRAGPERRLRGLHGGASPRGTSTRRRLHREAPARSASYTAGPAQLVTDSPQLGGALAGRPSTTRHAWRLRSSTGGGRVHGIHRTRPARVWPRTAGHCAGSTTPTTIPSSVTARAASRRSQSSSTAREGPATAAPTSPPSHAEREFGPE